MRTDDAFAFAGHKDEIEADIRFVRKALEKAGIEPEEGRRKLRRALSLSPPVGDADLAVAELLGRAGKGAADGVISARGVLSSLLAEPTPIIKALFFDESGYNQNQEKREAPPPANRVEKRPAAEALARLVERVTAMRYALLRIVRGQDYAVHAFADGVFNAGMAEADEKPFQKSEMQNKGRVCPEVQC
ncbi:MAG: hypothetical protein LBS62_04270 [Clostridiales bacterium]|nr:hypothetical protein [Clostridiales bacterium]